MRKAVKYWVNAKDISKVKLFLIKHLPILEVAQKRSEAIDFEFYNQNLNQYHNFISSVYFDNDQFDSYSTRMKRLQGSQLYRVRWYGGNVSKDTLLPIPNNEDNVYMEIKTHTEEWTGDQSTKERFPIDLKLLTAYLGNVISAEETFKIMQVQGKMKKADAGKHLALAQTTQQSMVRRGMHPVIRSVYHRTAFQLSDSNEVPPAYNNNYTYLYIYIYIYICIYTLQE